jgi:hypothetical protein
VGFLPVPWYRFFTHNTEVRRKGSERIPLLYGVHAGGSCEHSAEAQPRPGFSRWAIGECAGLVALHESTASLTARKARLLRRQMPGCVWTDNLGLIPTMWAKAISPRCMVTMVLVHTVMYLTLDVWTSRLTH